MELPYKWWPREYQESTWNALGELTHPDSLVRRAIICCHRRWGKDEVMLHHNMCAAFERKGNYWYMLPEYSQARKAIWNAVNGHTGKRRIDEAFPQELRKRTLDNEMMIEFTNGSTWQLMGSDNYDSLVGAPPIGLTFSEFSISNPNSWEYLSPILMENGGWAIFNGTPRGKNHFYKLLEFAKNEHDWFSLISTVESTNVFSEEKLQSELRRLQGLHGDDYGKAMWLQEYYCSFDAAIPGAIWGDSLTRLRNEGRLCDVSHTDTHPVFTAWDLGRSDMTAVWFFQIVNERIKVIDYWADNFKDIEQMCHMLYNKAVERRYRYGTNWLPHDARPVRLGMGGKSIIQQFIDYRDQLKGDKKVDIGQFSFCPELSREDGIQAARRTLQFTEFDKVRCAVGFDHLQSYHRKYDDVKKEFSTAPVHDEHSHPADAFRYLSLVWRFSKETQIIIPFEQRLMAGSVQNLTFGDMKKQHFKKKRREMANKF